MITIHLNDSPITVETSMNLRDFLIHHVPDESGYAVALNRRFIAKSAYDSTLLQDADQIELVRAMQGG